MMWVSSGMGVGPRLTSDMSFSSWGGGRERETHQPLERQKARLCLTSTVDPFKTTHTHTIPEPESNLNTLCPPKVNRSSSPPSVRSEGRPLAMGFAKQGTYNNLPAKSGTITAFPPGSAPLAGESAMCGHTCRTRRGGKSCSRATV